MNPIFPITALLAIMLCGNVYPKQTLIAVIIVALLTLLYPLLMLARTVNVCG